MPDGLETRIAEAISEGVTNGWVNAPPGWVAAKAAEAVRASPEWQAIERVASTSPLHTDDMGGFECFFCHERLSQYEGGAGETWVWEPERHAEDCVWRAVRAAVPRDEV